MSEQEDGCGSVIAAFAFVGIIVACCGGAISCEDAKTEKARNIAAAPYLKFADENESKVRVLHLTEGLEGSKNKIVVVHCVVEGIKTEERRLIRLQTESNRIPLPGEVWRIKVERYPATMYLESRVE